MGDFLAQMFFKKFLERSVFGQVMGISGKILDGTANQTGSGSRCLLVVSFWLLRFRPVFLTLYV